MRFRCGINNASTVMIDNYTPYLTEHYGHFDRFFENNFLMNYAQTMTEVYKQRSDRDLRGGTSVNTITYKTNEQCDNELDNLVTQLYAISEDTPDKQPIEWLNRAGVWNTDFRALVNNNRFIFNTLAYPDQLIILYDTCKRDTLLELIKILTDTHDIIEKDNYCYVCNDDTNSKVIYIYDKVDVKEFEELIGIKLTHTTDTPAIKIRNELLVSLISELYDTDSYSDDLLRQYYGNMTKRTQILNNINTIDKSLNNIDVLFKTIEKTGGSYSFNKRGNLTIALRTELFNYDETLVNKIYERNGFLEKYGALSNWIIKKCFIENELSLLTQTTIEIDFKESRIERYGYWDSWHEQNMPYNPHIGRYNCFGQNGPELINLLQQGRWEEFIYCLKATLGNINFNDTTVCETYFDEMISESEDSYIWAINKSTGEELTLGDLIEMQEKELHNEKN